MPEIKNTFTQGKMNKDLDERIIPNGQYRDAMNVQVSTSEGSDIGTVQNILGNKRVETIVGSNFECVGSISNEKTNKLYWFVKSQDKNIILEFFQSNDGDFCVPVFVDLKANTNNAVLKFPQSIITGINIIDDLLLWTDNHNEPRKININRSIQGTIDVNTQTKLVVDGAITNDDVEEKHITVVKSRPLEAPDVVTEIAEKEEEKVFEKDFIRFCLRYKYNDGEYSAFGPFTSVVFKPGEFELPINETYNSGMLNHIKSITLKNLVPSILPKDVVQIDILYKQEDSTVVYSVDSLTPSDDEWNNDAYIVYNENIRAALPSNQFLRVWDNVPKKALAQEVTGNRIVYANYTQGYDLDTSAQQRPEITMNYKRRDETTLNFGVTGSSGLPSVKSQRNYQLGVVYGDAYGRETPVFTSSNASISVPWSSYDGYLNSTQSNQLTAELKSSVPSWAEYYKVFVKESSGDYFNLSMDRVYQNPMSSESEDEERTIWMSFPSSDRNKIKEEDYIVLKNKRTAGDNPIAVSEKNKFKVLDIKNEAPEAITYEMQSIGSVANVGSTNTPVGTVFSNNEFLFEAGAVILKIDKAAWLDPINGGGMVLESDTDRKEPLYFSFKDTTNGLTSRLYLISSIYENDSAQYIIRLKEPILESDNWAIDTTSTTSQIITTFDLQVNIEKRVKKDLNEFTGRFFVKIASTEFTRVNGAGAIEPEIISNIESSLVTRASAQIKFHADVANATNDFDHDTGIVNYNGAFNESQVVSGDKVTDINTHSGNAVSDRPSDWNAIGVKNWFIDSMFFKAGQSEHYGAHPSVARSGRVFYGGGTEHPDDVTNGSIVNNFGVGYSSVGNDDGSMMVNGLEGLLTTQNIHRTKIRELDANGNPTGVLLTSFGARNILQHPTYKKSTSTSSLDYVAGSTTNLMTKLSNDMSPPYRNRTPSYGQGPQQRFFIHLSFNAPGENLFEGFGGVNVKNFSANDDPNALKNNMQDIMCAGNWSKGENGSSDTVQVFNWWPGEGQQHNEGGDFAEPNWDKVYSAWDPSYNSPENKRVIDRLKKGQKFKFTGDGEDDVFTIKNDPKILRLYNHTSWHNTYVWDKDNNANNSGNFKLQTSSEASASAPSVGNNRSVEYHARIWADNHNNNDKRDALENILKDFGNKNNRRVCYVIELDKDPALNARFHPDNLNSVDTQVLEFLTDNVDSTGVLSRSKISVWETEPQKSTDLNIYYEATNAIPLRINNHTNILFAKPGDNFDIYSDTESFNLADFVKNGLENPSIISWGGTDGNELNVEDFAAEDFNGNWIGETIGLPDPNNTQGTFYYEDYDVSYRLYIKIYRDGSSFYTARVMGHVVSDTFRQFDPGIGGSFQIPMITDLILAVENYDLPVGLNWFNCISFNNGAESNKVQDDFNGNKLTSGARANATLEVPYKEENRKSGLIYSGLYNSTNGINNLNQFIMAEKITKDLNPTYGSIQKLFSRRISLIAFCEDRVVGITANKNALYNADGNPQIVASNAVLGDANPFVGDYGISQNPESFAQDSYRAYFTDKQRGAVLRLSMDGLTPISDAGMHDYFRDHLPAANKLIGSYDSYKQNYNITLSNYLPLNLIANSTLEEGQESQYIQPSLQEILLNTGLTGDDFVPASDPFTGLNITDNFDIETETVVVDHDEIAADPASSSPEVFEIPSTASDVTNNIISTFDNSLRDLFHVGHFHNADPFVDGVSMAKTQAATSHVIYDTSNNGPANSTNVSDYKYLWETDNVLPTPFQSLGAFPNNGWRYNSADRIHCFLASNTSSVIININDELDVYNEEEIRFKLRASATDIFYLPFPSNANQTPNHPNDVTSAANPHISFRLELVHGDNNTPVSENFLDDVGIHESFAAKDIIDAMPLSSSTHVDINAYWKFKNLNNAGNRIAAGKDTWTDDNGITLPIDNLASELPFGLNQGNGNVGVNSSGELVLHDDTGSSITRSAAFNSTGIYYDPVAMGTRFPTNNEKANTRVYSKVKLKITAWYTDGSGTSIGPNTETPDGTADFIENHPIYVGNLGESQQVSYSIHHVSGNKQTWVSPNGFKSSGHPSYTVTQIADNNNPPSTYATNYSGQAPATAIDIGSIQQFVPAWSQVTHSLSDWSTTSSGSANPFTVAEAQHGLATTVDPASLLIPAHAGSPISESELGNNVTLYGDGSAALSPTLQNDKITILLGGSGQVDIQQTLPSALVQDNWYELHVTYLGGPLTSGSLILRNVLEPGLATNIQLDNHVGLYSGAGNPNSGGLTLHDDGAGLLRGVFQVNSASNMVVNGTEDQLIILCNNVSPDIEIDTIKIWDITTAGTGGILNASNSNWQTNNQTALVNYYSTPTVFSENGEVKWVNSTDESEYLLQGFTSNGISAPQITADGYMLKFDISDYSGGELKGYVNNKLGDAGASTCEGFYFSGIQGNGTWIIKANFDGTVDSITQNGSASGSVIPSSQVPSPPAPGGVANFTTNSSYHDKIVFSPANTNGLTCSIDNISLVDITNTFISGSVDAWSFTGFDNTLYDFINFDNANKNIVFTNSPLNSSAILVGTSAGSTDRIQIEQNISVEIISDSSYRVMFDHDLTDGSISGYYFNANGKGFRIPSTTGSGTYDQIHVTDVADKTVEELSQTFVLYIDSVSNNGLNGTLDNFFIYREYADFSPQTISFSEDVRGWTSFKSFIPESGLNISKNYFTVKEGKLYRHHDESTRNWFYEKVDNNGDPIITKSTITAVMNEQPSLVKIFNTLNYEGSQSKIDEYVTDSGTSISNMELYNLEEKPGWYVESIETDKQKGSINEFVEKEGKWFNYMKGSVDDIKTSDLSFQGIGVITDIQLSSSSTIPRNNNYNTGGSGSSSSGSGSSNGGNGGGNGSY